MKQLSTYGDERTLAFCAFCGGETGTRDHCPSRVFLDEPYPENLPVVPACETCNGSFSADEEYLACLISCIIVGSTEPEAMPRDKTKRILQQKPALRVRIEQARSVSNTGVVFSPEHERVSTVITKLAKGHALYELHESCARTPTSVTSVPLVLLTDEERKNFENPEAAKIWPELGSRAMQRILMGTDITPSGWICVQPERYRFHALQGHCLEVRIVIHEYLACHAHWRPEW
jgi:hypothetical protein